MSIYQVSKDDIALMISAKVGATITASQFSVIGLRASKAGDVTTKNSKLHFLLNDTQVTYRGEASLYYDRLDLSILANFSPFSVNGIRNAPVYIGQNVYDVLDSIRDAVGIQFDTTDLVNNQVYQGDYGAEVVLQAQPTSIGWTGSYTLRMSGYPNIINAFYGRSLAGF